jgi:hypothetical protein
MLDVLESVSKNLNIENFIALDKVQKNSLFYGIVLRNEFDTKRIEINKKFDPKQFYTIVKTDKDFGVAYFYGAFLDVEKDYANLFSNLNSFYDLPKKHSIENYKKILSIYGLSCDNTYRFLSQGVYPIDSECREKLFNKKVNFNDFFKGSKDYPFFLTIVSPIIFYFSNLENNILEFKKYLQVNTSL